MRRRALAIAAAAISTNVLAQAPAPIPPIADADRIQSYNITSSTAQVQIGFPVFGDCTDLAVTIAGVVQPSTSGLWNCASNSGFALNTLPLPITDMVVNFTPPLTSGTLIVQGKWHPRNLTVPTASGINRREYEQAISTLIASDRETTAALISGPSLASPPPIGNIAPNTGAFTSLTAGPNVSFFPGATANVQSSGQPGADLTLAPCWPLNTCGLMLYAAPATRAQGIVPILRVERNGTYSGGVSTNTAPALWVHDFTPLYAVDAQWSILAELHNRTRTSVSPGGQNVAVNGSMFKDLESATVTITNASPAVVSWPGSGFAVADQVYFKTTGTLPSPIATGVPYYVIAAGLTANSFEISPVAFGSAVNTTTNGSGTQTAIAEKITGWGADFVATDNTGIANPTAATIGAEIDNVAIAGAATDANDQRVILSLVGYSIPADSAVHIGTGILLATSGGPTIDSGIRFAQIGQAPVFGTLISGGTAVAAAGMDFSQATISTNAILLAGGQKIASTAGSPFIVGATDGSDAAAGAVGELKQVTASVSLTTGTPTTVVSTPIGAGDWDCWGNAAYVPAATTIPTMFETGLSSSTNTFMAPPAGGTVQRSVTFTTGANQEFPTGVARFSSSSSGTVYLVAQANFSVSTMTVFGNVMCRRAR